MTGALSEVCELPSARTLALPTVETRRTASLVADPVCIAAHAVGAVGQVNVGTGAPRRVANLDAMPSVDFDKACETQECVVHAAFDALSNAALLHQAPFATSRSRRSRTALRLALSNCVAASSVGKAESTSCSEPVSSERRSAVSSPGNVERLDSFRARDTPISLRRATDSRSLW